MSKSIALINTAFFISNVKLVDSAMFLLNQIKILDSCNSLN